MTKYHKIETIYERDRKTKKVIEDQIKNPTYSMLKTWIFTEKIDGTNIRCIWKNGQLEFRGRTDKAQISVELFNWLYKNVSSDKLKTVFDESSVVIYGEGYGKGIQNGDNYSEEQKLIVFDILVDNRWWLDWIDICDVCHKLDLKSVPIYGEMSIEESTKIVKEGFPSAIGNRQAEGLVGKPPYGTLFDKQGKRLIIKLKTKDF